MRTKHKRIILLIQLIILGVVVFVISGILGMIALVLGAVSAEEVITYFEGLISGESLLIGTTFLKMNWKRIIEDFWDWMEGNDEDDKVSTRLGEYKKLLRK